MTHTKHTQSTRTTIALGAAAGLALIAGIAVRVDDPPQGQRPRVAAESPDLQARILLERAAIAEWARTQGLSGLSPASIAPPS